MWRVFFKLFKLHPATCLQCQSQKNNGLSYSNSILKITHYLFISSYQETNKTCLSSTVGQEWARAWLQSWEAKDLKETRERLLPDEYISCRNKEQSQCLALPFRSYMYSLPSEYYVLILCLTAVAEYKSNLRTEGCIWAHNFKSAEQKVMKFAGQSLEWLVTVCLQSGGRGQRMLMLSSLSHDAF